MVGSRGVITTHASASQRQSNSSPKPKPSQHGTRERSGLAGKKSADGVQRVTMQECGSRVGMIVWCQRCKTCRTTARTAERGWSNERVCDVLPWSRVRLDVRCRRVGGGCMSELLKCPFCGGEAETWDGAGPWHVVCAECGTIGSPCLSEAEAIAAWNSRAERTCAMIPSFTKPATLGDCQEFCCSACGEYMVLQQFQGCADDVPNYCPNCGARVVE